MGTCTNNEAEFFAERERFELSVEVNPLRRFSKPLVSATHPPLRECSFKRRLQCNDFRLELQERRRRSNLIADLNTCPSSILRTRLLLYAVVDS